ncbi:type III pantothenate kinase [Anaerotignum lactatifermentans]|uniref:Type III pantothenate kinase n=1 Tax=Anaerotignum lactatifermentans TaxID=160404 RepID=A0ABS2GBY2_9FIRM|nr:type III pantothenate kinase [Anaerotignum lactatifermentans]MBM6829554.1 type III pantothenate kinase [Anaerotignum lactatifermentans]MBM6878048.1 type III pantothenate kinase [Anaerotignum lactatifermentans]MBM6951122.1 type III pantothenate kinase [Anaerotignum lactatifermentans]
MILVIDVSNTNSTLGVFDGDKLVANWRLSTLSSRTSDETGMMIRMLFVHSDVSVDQIEAVVVSSVVPNVMYSLLNGIRKYLNREPMVVRAGMKTGINLRMENPKEMGTDRIVNLVAAYEIYGGPAIVVDYSTATTFDVVSAAGEFLTGITAPGIQICADALTQRAAQLPKIEIKRPASLITKNTVESIQAGLVESHIGETIYIIEQIKEGLGLPEMKVIATGGLAKVIDENSEIFDVYDPVLALQGLRLIYEKNKNRR